MFLEYTGAVFIIIFSYAIPLFSSSIRNDKYRLAAFYIVITALQFVSLFNYFIFTLPGAGMDASTFSDNAQSAAIGGVAPTFSVGTGVYEYILFVSYSIFGANKLVGQSLSVLVAALSFIFILRIARHLNIRGNLATALLIIVGLTPSLLFYVSLTFREAFQLLGLVGGIYFAYEAFSRKSLARLFVSSGFYIFMGIFHQVLLALSFTLILVTWVIYFLHSGTQKKIIIRNIFICAIAILAVGYIMVVNIPTGGGNDYLKKLVESGGVVNMIGAYRNKIENVQPRSSYGIKIDTTSLTGIGYGLVISYGYYLFGPGISSIEKSIDLIPFMNALGRILISLFLLYLLIKKVPTPAGLGYLLIVYFSVTAMWSIGTTNYGQAFRHNSLTDWILAVVLVIGIQGLINSKNRSTPRT